MNFTDKLKTVIADKNSLVCVGLDPDADKLPQCLKNDSDAVYRFCSEIIAATAHVAAAYKLNFAFFETYGSRGWQTLERISEMIPKGVVSIADAKRADIGNSSNQYALAILQNLNFDSITVSPYMGADSVQPFMNWPDKGVFVLALTSNPGSQDLQYLLSDASPVYRHVIERVKSWNENRNCGLVVGATHPGQIADIRAAAPSLPFLIPGIGTQGGSLEEAVIQGTDSCAGLAFVNSSRGIIFKSADSDFAEQAGFAAEQLNSQINALRQQKLQNGNG